MNSTAIRNYYGVWIGDTQLMYLVAIASHLEAYGSPPTTHDLTRFPPLNERKRDICHTKMFCSLGVRKKLLTRIRRGNVTRLYLTTKALSMMARHLKRPSYTYVLDIGEKETTT